MPSSLRVEIVVVDVDGERISAASEIDLPEAPRVSAEAVAGEARWAVDKVTGRLAAKHGETP